MSKDTSISIILLIIAILLSHCSSHQTSEELKILKKRVEMLENNKH